MKIIKKTLEEIMDYFYSTNFSANGIYIVNHLIDPEGVAVSKKLVELGFLILDEKNSLPLVSTFIITQKGIKEYKDYYKKRV